MSLAVSARFARALVEIALDPKNGLDPVGVAEQLSSFDVAIRESSELHTVLLLPAIPPAKKRRIINRLGDELNTPRVVRNFLFVLVDRRRVDLLGDIRRSYQSLLDERMGVVRAEVISALPLDEAERNGVADTLTRLSGKRVRCEYSVDPNLLGGVVARIGSTVYDGSVRGQLGALHRQLVAEA